MSQLPSLAVRRAEVIAGAFLLCLCSFGASTFALSRPAAGAAASGATTLPVRAVVSPSPHASSECIPHNTYTLPAPLSTDGRASGVYLQIDTPATYAVSGSTPTAIMDSIAACTPVRSAGLFAANTGYALSTLYRYAPGKGGLCRVTDAIVTLHTNQVFPAWTGGGDDNMSLEWANFIRNLHNHEAGHLALDKDYAQKTYDALRTAPAGNCAEYKASLAALVRHYTDELGAKNQTYDDTTKHGTTQGAVL